VVVHGCRALLDGRTDQISSSLELQDLGRIERASSRQSRAFLVRAISPRTRQSKGSAGRALGCCPYERTENPVDERALPL